MNILKKQSGVLEVKEASDTQKQREESDFVMDSTQTRPLKDTIIQRRIERGVVRRCLAGQPCRFPKRRKPKKKTTGRGSGGNNCQLVMQLHV